MSTLFHSYILCGDKAERFKLEEAGMTCNNQMCSFRKIVAVFGCENFYEEDVS